MAGCCDVHYCFCHRICCVTICTLHADFLVLSNGWQGRGLVTQSTFQWQTVQWL